MIKLIEPETQENSWDHLINDTVVMRRYIATHMLQDWDPGETWTRIMTRLDRVGVTEEDGIILTLTGTRRGQVAMDRGREVSEFDAQDIEERGNVRLPRFIAYDFRITDVTVTDGPQQRAELMMSNEARARADRNSLSGAIDKLTSFLAGGKDDDVSDATLMQRLKTMPKNQLEALLDQISVGDTPEEESAREAQKRTKK